VSLLKGDEAGALALFDEALGELRGDAPLRFEPVAVSEAPLDEEGLEDEVGDAGRSALTTGLEAVDPASARLRAWLRPFREARREAAAVERARGLLRERREDGIGIPVAHAWRLELELAPVGAEREAVALALEHAWVRGDLSAWQLTPLIDALAELLPAEALRFIPRLPPGASFESAAERARLLAKAKDERGAAAWLIARRAGGQFTAGEEVQAFDQWRRLSTSGSPPAPGEPRPPATWNAALPFWRRPPGEAVAALGAHLRQHPFDLLAARAALRSIAPADDETLRLVSATLAGAPEGSSYDDTLFLAWRGARGDLARSWRAARGAADLPGADWLTQELRRRRLRAADIDASLADLARLATPAGDARTADAAVAALELRQPVAAATLRAELRALRPATPLRPFHLAPNGAIEALRPRTLDWPLVAAALVQEVSR
jgi:hypothetical protein